LIATGTLAAGLLLSAGAAQACSVDGVPSLSVDGRLVAVNKSNASSDSWTPFVAPGRYPANHALALREDHARVAAALPPVAFKFPWRWHFGDGATARGTAVSHSYRHPGVYIVSVEAYFVVGTQKQWFTFDKATLHVR
jgi:hypothetical protein